MKNILSIVAMLLLTFNFSLLTVNAQVPDAINFQAIARDAEGEVMSNTPIQIRLTVLDGSATGTEVYQELRALTTNSYGSFSFQIGRDANYVTIGNFEDIVWEAGDKFLKIDYDPTNQFNWDLTLGTIEFVSVPYAFAAGAIAYIDMTGVADGDILIYNSTTEKFEPGQLPASTVYWNDILDIPTFATVATSGSYNDLFDLPTLFDGQYSSLTGKPSIPADLSDLTDNSSLLFDGNYNSLTNLPSLFSGSFADLTNTPTTIAGYGITDAFSGSYTDLTNKPDFSIYATKNMGNANITNLADPVNDQDAATKAYVDVLEDQIISMQNSMIAGGLMVKDIDGNVYGIVRIGTQVWMAEDLRVTTYPNGTPIPHVTDNTAWANLADDNTSDAYCFYNNNNGTDYGALYTYAAAIGDNWVNDNTVNQGVCPDGWHLPTDAEWTELTDYLGGTSIAGGKMKETGTSHWNSPNTGATNSSSFSALPGGNRYGSDGTFGTLGYLGGWWSATEGSGSTAWIRNLGYDTAEAYRINYNKSVGFSVRCVRD